MRSKWDNTTIHVDPNAPGTHRRIGNTYRDAAEVGAAVMPFVAAGLLVGYDLRRRGLVRRDRAAAGSEAYGHGLDSPGPDSYDWKRIVAEQRARHR